MDWPETYAVLAGGLVMLILRLGNIGVQWVARKLGVEEQSGLFQDPNIQGGKK